MKWMFVLGFVSALSVPALGGLLYAQEGAGPAPEVFCDNMKTGQLCTHGTSSALGLTPEKADTWLAAVRKYNGAVSDAILQLQQEAEGTLSTAQMSEVDRWFAVGMNVQMNQLLVAAPSKAKGVQE